LHNFLRVSIFQINLLKVRLSLMSQATTNKTTYKLVVVGDGSIGKTCMLIAYAKGEFPEDYIPTVFDNYVVEVQLQDNTIELELTDTAGQEELGNIRKLAYKGAHVFLVCFSVANPVSFQNLTNWVHDVKQHDPAVPFIIVGTCRDLRDNPQTVNQLQQKGNQCLTYQQGLEVYKSVGAYSYVECSAKTRENLSDVFNQAVSAIIHKKNQINSQQTQQQRGCLLL